jgi:hypothetical protein
MLLILVLAPLFCPSLAEEELRGFKKYADSAVKNTICKKALDIIDIYLNSNKKEGHSTLFRQKTHPQVP